MIFKQQLAEVTEKYIEWNQTFDDYLYFLWGPDELNEEDQIEASLRFQGILSDILSLLIAFGKFRDNWELPPLMGFTPFGHVAASKSGKLKQDFLFGFYANEFYLETSVAFPWNLKRMPDEYWIIFTELFHYGAFTFEECDVPTIDENARLPEVFRGEKSSVYKLIRNYLLLEAYSGGSMDIGQYRVAWSKDTPWDTLIRNGCEAFKRIYRLNYLLYRSEYQRMKAKGIPFS